MKPVVFHQDAEAELDAAMAYYESQRSGLGLDLQTDIARTIGRIQQHPQLFPLHNEGKLRKSPAKRFPYVIFYLTPWRTGATRSRRYLANRWSGNHSTITGQDGSQATTGTMCECENARSGQVCASGRSNAWGSSERLFSLTLMRSISPVIPGSS